MRKMLLILLFPALANAELVLSEIMANEPGDTVEYEWIELYNNSDAVLFIDNYIIVAGADSLIAGPFRMEGQAYAVLVRRLVAEDAQPSFERRWGNGSGFWGDDPAESYTAIDVEFSLVNGSGAVALIRIDSSYSDSYQWSSASVDGVSVERDQVNPPSANWHQCTDTSGSTPGQANSLVGAVADLTVEFDIEPRTIAMSRPEQFRIAISSPEGCRGLIEAFDDTGRRVVSLFDAPIGEGYAFFGTVGIVAATDWRPAFISSGPRSPDRSM